MTTIQIRRAPFWKLLYRSPKQFILTYQIFRRYHTRWVAFKQTCLLLRITLKPYKEVRRMTPEQWIWVAVIAVLVLAVGAILWRVQPN